MVKKNGSITFGLFGAGRSEADPEARADQARDREIGVDLMHLLMDSRLGLKYIPTNLSETFKPRIHLMLFASHFLKGMRISGAKFVSQIEDVIAWIISIWSSSVQGQELM